MSLRPIDLQNIINTSIEVAKVAQTRNDTPNLQQGQFAIQLQKEADRKKEQIQKGQGNDSQETKVKDEGERRRGQEKGSQKREKAVAEEENKEKSKKIFMIKRDIKHIDIKV